MYLNNSRLKLVVEAIKYEYRITQGDIAGKLGYKTTYLSDVINGRKPISEQFTDRLMQAFPIFNSDWLETGDGDMLRNADGAVSVVEATEGKLIPLLPVSAQGGTLGEFTMSVHMRDCEKILSPIRGVDFGIRVSGDSMSPEYPSGSIILIKKIDHRAFIEWGRCYVLDTQNGIVVKKISAPDVTDINLGLDYLYCVSVNPEPIYKPFRVPTESIIGIYRVKMLLDEK